MKRNSRFPGNAQNLFPRQEQSFAPVIGGVLLGLSGVGAATAVYLLFGALARWMSWG